MKKSDKTLYKLPHSTGWGSFFTAKFLSKQSFSLYKKTQVRLISNASAFEVKRKDVLP